MATQQQYQPPGINRSTVWLYGSLGFPLAMVGYPLGTWLPRAYDSYVGVGTAAVGFILFLAAIFDAVTDPLMGFASDQARTRLGRRRTWVLAGGPFLAVAFLFLLNPDSGSTAAYLAFWYLFMRLGTTVLGVPYGAWGAELSSDYHTRTWIVSAREKFVLFGLVGSALVPFALESMYGDATTALLVINSYTWLVVPLLPLSALLVVAKVPEPPPTIREGRVPFFRSLGLMSGNKLFLRLLGVEILITGGESFRNTLSVYFMQDYIGASRPGELYVIYFVMGLMAIPLWDWLARQGGKHLSLAAAVGFVSVVQVSLFMLEPGSVLPFYVLFALKGFCFGAYAYLPRAMLADVVDVDTARSGDARTGGYFAAHGFMTKCAYSIGGLSLPLLALAGYDTGVGATHTMADLRWLAGLYCIMPTLLFSGALYLCWTWPLDATRHAKLRRILYKRQRQMAERDEPADETHPWAARGAPRPAD